MSYILSAQRHLDPDQARQHWTRYEEYLASSRDRFPPSAFSLAASEWWYSFSRADAPHDSRLLELRVRDTGAAAWDAGKGTEIEIILQSAYEGIIRLHYPLVHRYSLGLPAETGGIHDDWRYDQFTLNEDGRVVHTIEWARGGLWEIEASDVIHGYTPPAAGAPSQPS